MKATKNGSRSNGHSRGTSKKKTPKTGVVTKPDGTQYLEEKMTGNDFEDRADKLAALVAEHSRLGEEYAKIKDEKGQLLRDCKAKRTAVEERMAFLGYEVKHRVKKVPRQQTLPKVSVAPPAKDEKEGD